MLLLSACQAVPTQPVSRHQGRRRLRRAGMKCHTPPCAAKGRLGARTQGVTREGLLAVSVTD